MPRKFRHHRPKEAPVANSKGWQVTRYVPGSDDELQVWFDYADRLSFLRYLTFDLGHKEALVRVEWVGF